MDYNFTSLQELFKRVRPALHAKEVELHRLGYSNIKEIDVWNYLIENKWKKGKGLMLSDIVDDILNTECDKIHSFIQEKEENKAHPFEDTDII